MTIDKLQELANKLVAQYDKGMIGSAELESEIVYLAIQHKGTDGN